MSEASHWFDPLVRRVAVASSMELVRVRAADWVGVGSLLRALVRAGHSPHVTTRVEALREVPHGAVALYLPREDELEALNLLRPWFAARALRLILWSTAALRAPMQNSARDVLDWLVESVDVNERVLPFWQANLRAAVRAGAPGFRWDASVEFETLLRSVVASPRVRVIDVAGLSFSALSSVLAEHHAAWIVVKGLHGPGAVSTKRLRWAAAHTGHRRLVLDHVRDRASIDGWWTLHTEQRDPMTFEAERVADVDARARQRDRLLRAALVDFEPCAQSILDGASIHALATQRDPVAASMVSALADPWEALAAEGWTAATRGRVHDARWLAGRDACVERARAAIAESKPNALDVRRAIVECRAAHEIIGESSRVSAQPAEIEFELFAAAGGGMFSARDEFGALARRAGDPATARELLAQHRSERWASERDGLDDGDGIMLFDERIHRLIDAGYLDDALVVIDYAEDHERSNLLPPSPWLPLRRIAVHARRGEWALAYESVDRARALAPQIEPADVEAGEDPWFAVAAAEPARCAAALVLEIALLRRGRWTTDEEHVFDELRSQFGSSIQQDIRVRMVSSRVAAVHALIRRDMREALDDLLECSQSSTEVGTPVDTRYALILAAWCQRELGMIEDARVSLHRVLAFDAVARNAYHPDKLRAFVELARVDRAEGRYKRARAKLTKALRRYPSALPETAPELRAAALESATLALVESPVTTERLAEAERALAALIEALSPVHWEVRRAESEIAAARRRL